MNRFRLSVGCGCILVVSVISACGRKTETSTLFEENKSLFAEIGKADQLTLYEGLPHPNNETQLFELERGRKETVNFHGELFYREPLEVTAEEKEKLRALLGTERSFLQWQGEKKCGGFHPDYCAEWRAGDKEYRVLICFGCCEVKVYGPDKTLRCDIRSEAIKQLRELLKKHRKNRPPSEE